MCGIVGVVGRPRFGAGDLARATGLLAHRGPDGEGYLGVHDERLTLVRDVGSLPIDDATTVAFGHRRLAILDESATGDQPFVDPGGRHALVYNGEVYNFVELRAELERAGHEFRSTGDTEVLFAGYREWGAGVCERLVGMWAFAVVDLERGGVLLSRDRFGIKPLFLLRDGATLLVASEIKALRALARRALGPDPRVVGPYVVEGITDDGVATFFEGIERFPAASSAFVSFERPLDVAPRRYWEPPSDRFAGTATEAVERFAVHFDAAVTSHLRSDVDTGSCLSGGLDSSAIVMTSARARESARGRRPHVAFGFCSDDETVSERPYMEIVAAAAGLRLIAVEAGEAAVDAALAELLRIHDEPVGSASVLAQWFVFDAVHRAGIKVVLDGQGADELLGGYHSYFGPRVADLLRGGHVGGVVAMAREYQHATGAHLPVGAGVVPALLPGAARRRVSWLRGARHRALGTRSTRVLSRSLRDAYLGQLGDRRGGPPTFREALTRDLYGSRLPSLLRYEDQNSMAHSVEARVPFLDHRLVDFASSLPDDLLMRGIETKYVLREAMRDRVPPEVLARRDKIGFRATPSWTADFVTRRLGELVPSRTDLESEWFEPGEVETALCAAAGGPDAEFLAWRLTNVKLWARTF